MGRVTAFCLGAALMLNSAPTFAGDVEIKQGGDALVAALESMPYASEGTGPVVYAFTYSECPHAQKFERDWSGKLQGIEMRWIMMPVSDRTANETAYLALKRNPADYHAFMNGRSRAPRFKSSNQLIVALNSVIASVTETINPILQRNGIAQRLGSPQLFWVQNDRVMTLRGYDKMEMRVVLNEIRGQGAESGGVSPQKTGTSAAHGLDGTWKVTEFLGATGVFSSGSQAEAQKAVGKTLLIKGNHVTLYNGLSCQITDTKAVKLNNENLGSGGVGWGILGIKPIRQDNSYMAKEYSVTEISMNCSRPDGRSQREERTILIANEGQLVLLNFWETWASLERVSNN